MGSQSPGTSISIYQLYISLHRISPLVWRRVLVKGTTSIAQLHDIVQCSMGWEDLHLHRFCIHGKDYGIYQPGGLVFDDDPAAVSLADFRLRAGERFIYEYDFGDFWQHDIRLERVLPLTPGKRYPLCIAGGGDCPPEDCGGPEGYRALVKQQHSWLADFDLRDDVLLVAERLLAFYDGGPRPTRDDTEFVQALHRLEQHHEECPAGFDRRAVNVALSAIGKDCS
jgi:hypothetical protein